MADRKISRELLTAGGTNRSASIRAGCGGAQTPRAPYNYKAIGVGVASSFPYVPGATYDWSYRLNNTPLEMETVNVYDIPTENLLSATHWTAYAGYALAANKTRALIEVPSTVSYGQAETAYACTVETKSYNFMGNPLEDTVTEERQSNYPYGSYATTRIASTEYAYWGQTKYFQQKAIVDPQGRISYTDYFPSTGTAGTLGQTCAVYDNKNGAWGSQLPSDWVDNIGWNSTLAPGSAAVAAATFTYDTYGRPTTVQKLGPSGAYVLTVTNYQSSGNAPDWGQAYQVIEDTVAGWTPGSSTPAGHACRVTQTSTYTPWGKPQTVQDAAGHVFYTAFDQDGNVQSVTRTDVTPNVPLVSYIYGSSGVTNGVVTSVTDGLTGVTQSISYWPQVNGSGYGVPGVGQPSTVSQSGGQSPSYTVSYTYAPTGDRQSVTYPFWDGTSASGTTTTWYYTDYVAVGDGDHRSNVFQTLDKLDSNLNRTSEELHYGYDTDGRLVGAAFAQTPQSGQTGYGTQPAAYRARAYYVYDAGGRTDSLAYYWDTWNASNNSYSSVPIFANNCTYELSTGSLPSSGTYNRGVKLTNSFSVGQGSNWVLDHFDSFGYDANYDYLTSAAYGDGQANPNQSWTYDYAGNRSVSGYSYDNLNRMLTAPGVSYANDILGNRSSENNGATTTTYGWDARNRMTGRANSTTAAYEYRPDGLRTFKSVTTSGSTTTEAFRYDGQVPFEDETLSGSTANATRSTLGPRGIDAVETAAGTTSSGALSMGATTVSYPIYDAHGNRICGLTRYNTNYYSTDTPRYYGAWGEIREGATTGGSSSRHCGSLGHVQDDESGLIYMRARLYEPANGRFINQDPAQQRLNWFTYCSNDPVNRADQSGTLDDFYGYMVLLGMAFTVASMTFCVCSGYDGISMSAAGMTTALTLAACAVASYCIALNGILNTSTYSGYSVAVRELGNWILGNACFARLIATGLAGAKAGQGTDAELAVLMCTAYMFSIMGALAAAEQDDE